MKTGDEATAFEVLDLAPDGTMTRPAQRVTFQMGTALASPIVFTPDGAVGLVAQDDGSVGSFRFDAAGSPTVVQAAYRNGFYASAVVVDPGGTRAWVLDANTAENGGGVYEVTIACDGTLTSQGLAIPIAPANAMAIFPGDPRKAVVASRGDLHIVDLRTKKSVSSGKPFGDDNALPSSVAVAPDGKYALVADDSVQGGNRMAWATLGATIGTGPTLATPFPAAVAISPFANAAIVLNDDATDQIHVMSYDASSAGAPFVITGELAYKFGKPQIPTTVSTILRGDLEGRAFIGENLAVRELTFAANGTVIDTQKLELSGDHTSIVGVVGVQP
jgi:DNA-binding beta-propeller fold protein YncE